MDGQYEDGERAGLWARWEENGDLAKVRYFSAFNTEQTWGFRQRSVWTESLLREDPIQSYDEVKWTLFRRDQEQLMEGRWKKGERIPFAEEIYDSAVSTLTIYTCDDSKLMTLSIEAGTLEGPCVWWNPDGRKLREEQFVNNRCRKIISYYIGEDAIVEPSGVDMTLGGRSVSFDEQVLPLLKQNEPLAEVLLDTLEFQDRVHVQSDFSDHRQVGRYLGPYTVFAKPKGSSGEWEFEITVRTTWTVYDRNGQEIPLRDERGRMSGIYDRNAVRLEETFESLTMKPWS